MGSVFKQQNALHALEHTANMTIMFIH